MRRTPAPRLLPVAPLLARHAASCLVALALLAGPARAQDADDAVTAVDRSEVDAYTAARARYADRMQELDADTRRFVAFRETEERAKVSEGYDSLIGALDEIEREKRDVSIERFERFLSRYPDSAYSSDVRFRLADLLWERAREQWLDDHAAYDLEEAELLEQGRFDELRPEPMVDLSPSIGLYSRIIQDNQELPEAERYEYLDGAYYMLGFAYKDENAAQRDEDLALEAFQGLIDHASGSDLVDTAHLYIGNILFDNARYEEAMARYRLVMDNGPSGRHYMDGMYYLAWSHYKISSVPEDYPPALELFDLLLETSEQDYRESGRKSDYQPDAVKYMAHSFADISEMTGADATTVADTWFNSRGRRAYDREIYEALGDVLVQYGRYRDAVGVYRRLQQPPWELEPDNPDHQFQVVRLLATVAANDLDGNYEESAAARVELTAKYNEGSPWWNANRHDPEALQNALDYIEGSLSTVAREYWINAENTGEPADFAAAAREFQQYLDTFPIADDYYEHQWYLAAALYNAGEIEAADAEYASLIKSSRQHGYGDGALYQSVLARRRLLEQRFGPPQQLPPSAAVERTYTTPAGKEIEVYALSPEHQRFVEGVDSVLDHTFTPSEAEGALPYEELQSAVDKNRPAFSYIVAQVLVTHHHYEDALPRLKAIIDTWPYRNEASYAAGDVLDIYTAMGDLDALRDHAKQYRMMSLGETEDRTDAFANLEEQATFKQAQGLVADGDLEAGAAAYMQFYQEYPKSEYASDALLNAANNYQRAGRAEQAIELFEEFVRVYPDEPRAEELYFRIAANYESIFELEQAVRYYDELVRRFPDSEENASAALYNVAFLRTGLGDHAGAGAAYEQYGTQFAGRADAEDVYFRAARQYELAGDAAAESFYKRYLDRYGNTGTPDHILQAKHALGEYALKRADPSAWNRYQAEVSTDFRAFASSGKEIGWKGAHYAAEGAFRELQADYDVLVSDTLSGDEERDAKLVIETKPQEVTAFEARANAFISTYGDFETSMAALYLVASAYLYNADMIYSLKCPPKYNEEQCDVFMEIVYTELYPAADAVQAKAMTRFNKVIDTAAELGQYNDWVAKAKDSLNELDPFNYPDEKAPIAGGSDATIYPDVTPRAPDAGEPSAEPAGEDAAPSGSSPWAEDQEGSP